MSKYTEIRNNFTDEDDKLTYIDAWYSDNDNEEGEIIAKVNLVTKKVEYLDEDAKADSYAQEVIQEVLKDIENGDYDAILNS